MSTLSKTELLATPLDEIPKIRLRLRAGFATDRSRDIAYRKTQLAQLAHLLQDNRDRIYDAIKLDFNRAQLETEMLEIGPVLESALAAHSYLKKWTAPERAPFSLNWRLSAPTIYRESKGTVLIVGPFNYPVYSNFMPLIGAISAGCAVVLKPSELTPNSTALLTELLPKYLDPEMYAIVNGSIPEMKTVSMNVSERVCLMLSKLLGLQWDHIFFTGSTNVGRIVAKAAAEFLTPVSLELGGKNAAIVDSTVDFDAAARSILWAKTANSGQTCIAPDFVMVHKDAHDKFITAIQTAYKQFWPDAAAQPEAQAHVVNNAAFKRMVDLLTRTKGTIVAGGGLETADEATNYFPATLVDNTKFDDSLMEHEIFGPILPIVTVENIEEAVEYSRTRASPLACYVFTNNSKVAEQVRLNTRSGAFVQNDAMIQGAMWGLPFGGVGDSGYGPQGGKYTFELFTYHRAVATPPGFMEKILALRYPPYTPTKLKLALTAVSPKVSLPRAGGSSAPLGKMVASFALIASIVAAYRYKLGQT
ncbi:NAD-dependent aldehyde dehydrogenase [Auriculariales sp. MPI-PUGE-AT-0066]|nr:NAD-dependent aldehyde dehydrogenase [Auriculariales sp. MPI-PUGE-AT-0066]